MDGAVGGWRGPEGWPGLAGVAQHPTLSVPQKEQAEEFEARQRKGFKRSESVEKAQVGNWDPESLGRGGLCPRCAAQGLTGPCAFPGQEAATLIAQRAVNPRDIFKQREKAGPGDAGMPAQPGMAWGHGEGAEGWSQSPPGSLCTWRGPSGAAIS